MSLWKI